MVIAVHEHFFHIEFNVFDSISLTLNSFSLDSRLNGFKIKKEFFLFSLA